VGDSFSFFCIDEVFDVAALGKITSNATALDEIPPVFMKVLLPWILPVLTELYNYILTSSTFPLVWKISSFVPIPIVHSPTGKSDYRPICILPVLAKAFENVMQMVNYVGRNGLISSFQSGFRPSHSTATAITRVSDDIHLNMESNQPTILVLLDFSKAFDSVCHELFILMMHQRYGSGTFLFLSSPCYQKFAGRDDVSPLAPFVAGVSQGSLISPLCFFCILT
jgi:hypothetical protein